MRAYRLTDYMTAKIILANDVIKGAIYEDGADFKVPDVINEVWVAIEIDDERIIGCYRLHQLGHVLWQVHAFILPNFRMKHSVRASKTMLKWASYNIGKLNKIIAIIPEVHSNVIAHADAVGLKKEGVLKESFLKNKTIIDQEIWSISRENIEKL